MTLLENLLLWLDRQILLNFLLYLPFPICYYSWDRLSISPQKSSAMSFSVIVQIKQLNFSINIPDYIASAMNIGLLHILQNGWFSNGWNSDTFQKFRKCTCITLFKQIQSTSDAELWMHKNTFIAEKQCKGISTCHIKINIQSST